ncbi:MAG: DUF2087 domain-containing protein [Acetobacterium woodii]|nr:DUF2087 domain-containing protein [Acetobacterium woodii]
MQKIKPFLNEEGKITQIPAKQSKKLLVYKYLAEKFDCDQEYSEKSVNQLINSWHTFGDFILLRRGLVETGFLCRLPDGSKYWKNKEKEQI